MTRTRGRRTPRGVLNGVLGGVVVLPLSGLALVATAPAAGAAVNQPVDGTTFTSNRPVPISADYGRSSGTRERLLLTSPGGGEVEVYAETGGIDGGTLDYTLNLACWTPGCAGTRPAPNGTWTVRQDGSTTDTSTFRVAVPPAAPEALAAEAISSREVRVSWRRGAEPDLTGFEVLEGGAVVQDGIGLDSCAGSTCSAVIRYAAEGSGEHTYSVRAFRSSGDGGTLASPPSGTASARLDAPPPSPQPAPSTGDGGGTGSGSGSNSPSPSTGGSPSGSTAGPSSGSTDEATGGPAGGTTGPSGGATKGTDAQAVSQRKAFALGFSAFGPKLGIPKLPPLPQTQAPAIAPELADGTFEPTLGFEDQVVTERVEVAQGPTQQVRHVMGSALDSERLATSTAAALVLLMAGAHLRRWLAAAHEEH